MINIKTLKKLNSISQIKRIKRDLENYGAYTNYEILIKYFSNSLELRDFLNTNKIEYILQNTIHSDLYILRLKSHDKF